jgi:hypothetical protein
MSTTVMSTVSTRPPTKPLTRPSDTPTRTLTTTARTPTTSETRAPCTIRLRMSRPTWSVPSRYDGLPPGAHTGGVKRRIRLCLAGSWGVIHGAASAAPTTTARISSPSNAAGLRANLRHARESDAIGAPAPSYASPVEGRDPTAIGGS